MKTSETTKNHEMKLLKTIPWVEIGLASQRTPEAACPKTAAETAGGTAGENQCWGECRKTAFSCREQRSGSLPALPTAVPGSSPGTTPQHSPQHSDFPRQSPSSLRSSFGECGLAGPLAGQPDLNPWAYQNNPLRSDWMANQMSGGHLKPVTLKPVIRIFRIFRVSRPHFPHFPRFCSAESPQTFFSGVRRTVRVFRIFPVSVSNR